MSTLEKRRKARRKAQLTGRAQFMRRAVTPSEQALWQAIRGCALGVQFRRQAPIAGLFIGDFVASELKLVLEVDGNSHNIRQAADARRDAKLKRLGYVVLRLPAELVERQLAVAVERIREVVAALAGPR